MSPIKSLASLLLLALATSQAACAAPTAEDDSAGGAAQASTIGGRFRDPLEVGVYDGRDSTLTIYNYLDKQKASFTQSYLKPNGMVVGLKCYSVALDITDEGKHLKDDGCDLTLTVDNGALVVKGTNNGHAFADRYVRRQPNSLVGTYVAKSGDSIHVDGNDGTTIKYSLTPNGGAGTASSAQARTDLPSGEEDTTMESTGACHGFFDVYRLAGSTVIGALVSCNGASVPDTTFSLAK